ncbi:MAG: hypothetical protein IPP79_08330 [Chitinophagaceae bacterium]|nr:hypothetical protein [Chitinophagaceae bacterium]
MLYEFFFHAKALSFISFKVASVCGLRRNETANTFYHNLAPTISGEARLDVLAVSLRLKLNTACNPKNKKLSAFA